MAFARNSWCALLLSVPVLLAGCSVGVGPAAPVDVAATSGVRGRVLGGQQPVAGAAIQLYGVGTAGDGSAATPLLTAPVSSDAGGGFNITGLYSCTGVSEVYLTATGGNAGGGSNPQIAAMAALGPCSSLTQSTFISIDEVTTVAAVAALAPYMNSVTTVGSGSADAPALAQAFALASEFASYSGGSAPGTGAPAGYTVPTATINTLADIVSTCINSSGGAGCGSLFNLTTANGNTPTDTVAALLNLARNPTLNTVPLYNLTPAAGPFQPVLTMAPPDFRVRLTPPASAMALQFSAASETFPATATGYASPAQSVTITNTSAATIPLSGLAITGANAADFTLQSACGASLQATANCTIQLAFAPTAAGSRAAYLGVSSSTADSPQYVALSGMGSLAGTGAALQLSTSSLTFTSAAETTSAAQTVTVTNTGTATLTITGLSFTGPNAPTYSEADTCAAALAPAATCTISVSFKPFLAAMQTATLNVSSNAGLPRQVALSGNGSGGVTLTQVSSTQWIITNGTITFYFNPASGHLYEAYWNNNTGINLVDTTSTSGGQPNGLYMDDTGTNYTSGAVTSGFTYGPGNSFVDFWIQSASSSTNAFTVQQHYIVSANDNGFHVYSTVNHGANDIAGNIGQWQYVYRIDLNKFTETYEVDSGLGNLGVIDVPQPSIAVSGTTDPGRQVQNAAVDLHGLPLPAGFTRNFYTKYDYSSYEYLHRAHGVYGSTYGAWTVIPNSESLVGGPTKQDLIFTDNLLIMEAESGHLDNDILYTPPQGVATTRIWGPYYFHFNAFDSTHTTPASLYAEAVSNVPSFNTLYDSDPLLTGSGYQASTGRGAVAPVIAGGGSAAPNTAWTVLSDAGENFQYSSNGNQYWTANNAAGNAALQGVTPGTYRLSSYVLGQWGELRQDGVAVTAGNTTSLPALTFTPENFGTAPPVFTIGTPDRSAHEFLHGEDANGNDLRNFYGAYNYWADFASTSGQQIYYATAVGSTPATNDLSKLNYVQWQSFDPGLYAGIYNSSDDTTDGYTYIVPTYVGNPSTAKIPATTIHFSLTAAQMAQGQYAVLSTALASVEASYTVTLNGHALTWHYINASDAMIRSGLSGYYQWIAYQWDASALTAAGGDNVLTFGVSQADGVMPDAFRLEITSKSASPAVTGWHDYEFLYNSAYTPANDALPNN